MGFLIQIASQRVTITSLYVQVTIDSSTRFILRIVQVYYLIPLNCEIRSWMQYLSNRWSIKKDSEEEKNFISSIITGVKNLDTSNIGTKDSLENSVQQLKTTFDYAWINNLKLKRITKHSKEWWNMECSDSLNRY